MDNMMTTLKEMLMLMMGRPETLVETVLVAVIPLLVGVLVLGKLGRSMDAKEESFLRSIIVLATGAVVVVLGLTVAELFIVPAVSPALGKWMGLAVALVLTLAITVPVCLLVLKQTYVSAAITTILAALIYLTGFSYDQIIEGMGKGKNISERRETVEKDIIGK